MHGESAALTFVILVINFSLPRTFGRMVGDNRQGYAIVTATALMAMGSIIEFHRLRRSIAAALEGA